MMKTHLVYFSNIMISELISNQTYILEKSEKILTIEGGE